MYSPTLVRRVLEGPLEHLEADGMLQPCTMEVGPVNEESWTKQLFEYNAEWEKENYEELEQYVDHLHGGFLVSESVRKAREDEMKFIRDMHVYDKVPRSLAWRAGKKVIGVRWIDVNKGDSINPRYRSRLVAKAYKM